jgi:hypothetical protein
MCIQDLAYRNLLAVVQCESGNVDHIESTSVKNTPIPFCELKSVTSLI